MKNSIKKGSSHDSYLNISYILASVIIGLILIPSIQSIFDYNVMPWLLTFFIIWMILITAYSNGIWLKVVSQRKFEILLLFIWFFVSISYVFINPQAYLLNIKMGSPLIIIYFFLKILILYIMGVIYLHGPFQSMTIIRIIFYLLGLNALLTIPLILGNEFAVREFINIYQQTENQNIFTIGFGGLGLYAVEAFMFPILLVMIIKSQGISRILLLFCLFIIFIHIILSSLLGPTIILLAGLVLFSFSYLLQKKQSLWNRVISFTAIVILIITGTFLLRQSPAQLSLNKFSYLINPENISTFEGNTIPKRQMLYLASIKTFLEYPILGAGLSQSSPLSNYNFIGGHSGILDGFAMYGMFFFLYILIILRKIPIITRLKDPIWKKSLLIGFLAYLMIAVTDPVVFDSSVTGIFFLVIGSIYPFTSTVVKRKLC